MAGLPSAARRKRYLYVVKIPRFPAPSNRCVSLLNFDASKVELCLKQEIQIDGLAICRDLTDKIRPTIVPRLRHCNELGHNVLPLEPKTVRDKSLKTYSEVSRFSADDSLDRSIEPWKSFGWNPVFDVRGRPDSMHLVIAKVRIAHNERGVFLFSKVTTHTLELGR